MADLRDVLGVVPADWMVARRHPAFRSPGRDGALDVLPVALPPSWASRTARIGQRMLWRRIVRHGKAAGRNIGAVVVTSPHYIELLKHVPPGVKTFYYASDDYRSYEGWNRMAELEAQLVRRVDHAFFVSAELMERARREYGVGAEKTSVSMNATEKRFFPEVGDRRPAAPPAGELERPVAGIVGGINHRLDFNLLLACAELPELGTLLLVGPLPDERSEALGKLLAHPKCVAVGSQPHGTIHRWFQCLDVGLIPYVHSQFNQMCSPMRLFDHLASGAPLVATDACAQANGFGQRVDVCAEPDAFVAAVRRHLAANGATRSEEMFEGIAWEDRARAMLSVMEDVGRV